MKDVPQVRTVLQGMLYVQFPMSLRSVNVLLAGRGIEWFSFGL